MWRLVRIVLGLTLTFVISQMVVLVGAKTLKGEHSDDDLFAPYADIMPGEFDLDLPKWCASYDQVYPGTVTEMICHLKLTEGYFPSGMVYVRNHTIDSVAFDVTGLSVGDLAKRWGHPRIEDMGTHGYNLYWEIEVYEVIVPLRGINHFSYWSPVTYLAITSGQEPRGYVSSPSNLVRATA